MLEHPTPNSATLSIVFPAYQEEKRIGMTMEAWSRFLSEHHPGTEVIVVCDGCTDGTAAAARAAFTADNCQLKVIELSQNQGKGNAVAEGVMAAQGNIVVFTDSDLSYEPDLLDEFLQKIHEGADLAIAQRRKKTQYPGLGRRLLAVGSRFLVGNFLLPGIRDTQAGFKAFKQSAAKELFPRARTKRFLFDLEILVIARSNGLKIEKVYVDWQDREGSTVRIFVDTMRSLRDLMLIYARVLFGAYKK
jgi:dolichyl-phosphate beta-glucosyltransferase